MATNPQTQGALDEIVALLYRIAAPAQKPVTRHTELYYDLGLAGDDLYEVITELRGRFGADFTSLNLAEYAPGETEAHFALDTLGELLGRPRRYRSLTVELLLDAIEAGEWRKPK